MTYVTELFSLPPPTDAEIDSGLYERYVLSLPPLHGKSLGYRQKTCLLVWLSVGCLVRFLLANFSLSVSGLLLILKLTKICVNDMSCQLHLRMVFKSLDFWFKSVSVCFVFC